MCRSIFIKSLLVLGVAILSVSCGTLYSPPPSPQAAGTALVINGPQCQSLLKTANQKLAQLNIDAKNQAVDFNEFSDMLAAATAAGQANDYKTCILKANELLDYIQRDENYIAWNNSLQS